MIYCTVSRLRWGVSANIVAKKIPVLSASFFSFLHNKVFTLLNNVNDELYSNDKDEVVSMIDSVHKLSNFVTHYASHRLRANVQFSTIENIKSMKTYLSIVYMVPEHKKKVLQMNYCEVQADYFGNKGMSMLFMM